MTAQDIKFSLEAGSWVSYWTGNSQRYVQVLTTPRPSSSSVLVSGSKYKHGGMRKPHRVYVGFLSSAPHLNAKES